MKYVMNKDQQQQQQEEEEEEELQPPQPQQQMNQTLPSDNDDIKAKAIEIKPLQLIKILMTLLAIPDKDNNPIQSCKSLIYIIKQSILLHLNENDGLQMIIDLINILNNEMNKDDPNILHHHDLNVSNHQNIRLDHHQEHLNQEIIKI